MSKRNLCCGTGIAKIAGGLHQRKSSLEMVPMHLEEQVLSSDSTTGAFKVSSTHKAALRLEIQVRKVGQKTMPFKHLHTAAILSIIVDSNPSPTLLPLSLSITRSKVANMGLLVKMAQ